MRLIGFRVKACGLELGSAFGEALGPLIWISQQNTLYPKCMTIDSPDQKNVTIRDDVGNQAKGHKDITPGDILTLDPTPAAPNPKPKAASLNPKPPNPQPKTPNPKPTTLNLKPQTLNPKTQPRTRSPLPLTPIPNPGP